MNIQTPSASRAVVASGNAGSVCQKTGPYVYNNGYIDIVVVVRKGDQFPSAPTPKATSGAATAKSQPTATTWSMVKDSEASPSAM